MTVDAIHAIGYGKKSRYEKERKYVDRSFVREVQAHTVQARGVERDR